jgi:hypothetical protein
MTQTAYKYLKFISFKDWKNWDPKKYKIVDHINSGRVLFEQILIKRNPIWIKIEDQNEYKILGVRSYGVGT